MKLLVSLMGDPRVSGADKALMATAVAYALVPIDLIPDIIPFFGQLDDLFFLALAIDRLVSAFHKDFCHPQTGKSLH